MAPGVFCFRGREMDRKGDEVDQWLNLNSMGS